MHNLLTVKETAKYLRIPLPTVYYLVQRGQLPAIQIGGRWRIKKDSLDKDILKEDQSGQPTVLVVDDDESLQNLFKVFLKKIGFSRVVVGTVKEAIAALEKQKFDLLFLDLKLPDGPADDVYDAAKEIDPHLPDRGHHRLSRQRDAQSDSGQRAGHGSEKAAQSRPAETDGSHSRVTKKRPGKTRRVSVVDGRVNREPSGLPPRHSCQSFAAILA